jgi:hypothetical protein
LSCLEFLPLVRAGITESTEDARGHGDSPDWFGVSPVH